MNYYDENQGRSRLYGSIAALSYCVVVALLFAFISLPNNESKPEEEVYIEFVDEEVEPKQPPRPRSRDVAPQHQSFSREVEQKQQVSGSDAETRTANPKLNFSANMGGPDEPEQDISPIAPLGDETTLSGNGQGINMIGDSQLDAGLQGRGVVGSLPKPQYPGNVGGRIVISVKVNSKGEVTDAQYKPQGSTSNDPNLIKAAKAAAMKARFHESKAQLMGGEITYMFNLN